MNHTSLPMQHIKRAEYFVHNLTMFSFVYDKWYWKRVPQYNNPSKTRFSNNARPLNYITSSVNERKYGWKAFSIIYSKLYLSQKLTSKIHWKTLLIIALPTRGMLNDYSWSICLMWSDNLYLFNLFF